jgi:hypothetical protein
MLNDMQAVYIMQHLGLCAAAAMDDSADITDTDYIDNPFDNRCIGPGRRQHQFSRIQRTTFHFIRQQSGAGINEFLVCIRIIRFRIFFRIDFGKGHHGVLTSARCCPYRRCTGFRNWPDRTMPAQ